MSQTRVLAAVVTVSTIAYLGWYLLYRATVLETDDQADKSGVDDGTAPTVQSGRQPAELSPAVQAQVQQLGAMYEKMGQDFSAAGLDVPAIAALKPWFHGFEPGEVSTWPKRYDQMVPPFKADMVRLLVIPLDGCPGIASLAAAATAKVTAQLPQGIQLFSNSRTQYHITVFHTSHPVDPRPDPFSLSGGVECPSTPAHLRGPTSKAVLDRESEAMRQVVASQPPPELEVVSIVMARSGTLLLTWIDRSGRLTELRNKLRGVFPGATSKQATIIHSTLTRIASPEQLPAEIITRITETCEELTHKIKGRRYTPETLWWVNEAEFSTVVGHRQVLPMAQLA